MSGILILLSLVLVVVVLLAPFFLISGIIQAFSKNPEVKKRGMIIILVSLAVIVIGFSVCSGMLR